MRSWSILNLESQRCRSSSGFIGEINDFIALNCSLTILDLSGNDLSGPIPKDWASDSFVTFDVSSNRLSGTLPAAVGSLLSSTASFNVSNNDLTGRIPADYYKTLRSFDISHNSFDVCADASNIAQSNFSPTLFCALYPQEDSLCACAESSWPSTCDFSIVCDPAGAPLFLVPQSEPLSPVAVSLPESNNPPSGADRMAPHSAYAIAFGLLLVFFL